MAKKERVWEFDLVKVILILLMVLSHSISLLASPKLTVLMTIRSYIDVIAFTGFVTISGLLFYVTNQQVNPDKLTRTELTKIRLKIFKSALILLVTYFLLALISFNNFHQVQIDSLDVVLDLLLLRRLPNFTEFLVFFFLLRLTLAIFYKQILQLMRKPRLLLYFVIIFVIIAAGIDILMNWGIIESIGYARLFIGSKEAYYFPLVQYLVPFFIGSVFGYLYKSDFLSKHRTFLPTLIGISLLLLMLANHTLLVRWPPNVLFLLTGLLFITVMLVIVLKLRLKFSEEVRGQLQLISNYSLVILVVHTLLSVLTCNVVNYTTDWLQVLGLTIALGFSSYGAAFIYDFLKKERKLLS